MSKLASVFLVLARIALGWLFFYAGLTKILNPDWTSASYLGAAKTFPAFYTWLSGPGIISVVDFLNEWGLLLLGISLILGLGVRISGTLGAILMVLYYLPVLDFPNVDHGYLVDEHIVYALVLLFFVAIRAGKYFGIDKKLNSALLG